MTGNIQSSAALDSALASLQPIRDLSRNWDVDIASCLEEYLQELVGLSGGQLVQADSLSTEDNKESIPNFAHAALILQNSSNVYGRKVEYLHSLVYKALYEFFKNTSGSARDAKRKSGDASLDEFYDFDPNEEFLLLDDVLPGDPTCKKINLKEADDETDLLEGTGTPFNQSFNRTRLSLGGLSMTRADRSSIGAVTSSAQQRALLGTLNNGSLRLVGGRCDIGEDGVLLMPGSRTFEGQTESELAGAASRNLFNAEVAQEYQGAAMDCDDDHSNDGPGFAFHDDCCDDDAGTGFKGVDGGAENVSEIAVLNHYADTVKKVTFAALEQPKPADPWQMLDPHSCKGFTEKPLRKGLTYRLPKGIDLPPSECVTGSSTRQTNPRAQNEEEEENEQMVCLSVQRFRSYLDKEKEAPEIRLKGLIFGREFEYVAKRAAKKRAAARRLERLELQGQAKEIQGVDRPQDYEDDEDDDDGGFYFGGEDNDDDENEMGNAGVSSLDEVFNNGFNDPEENSPGQTFEELCRAHIRAFAKGAEDFALSTKLTERVGKWQEKLAPILEEEERRSAFDIHQYSQQLIDTAQNRIHRLKRKSDGSQHPVSSRVQFESVTRNCTRSDVCRLFLASLSLANSGNIEIAEGSETYQFDLISNSVSRPMETYRAPSLTS